jgi:hypothetical protein
MIHCTPVVESERSSWIVGTAMATIVWSMKVIETAKIIAARISLLFWAGDWFMAAGLPYPRARGFLPSLPGRLGSSSLSGIVAAAMPSVFWLGLGIAGFIFLVGVITGARSRTASVATGAAIGAYLGIMLSFPLLAIGLATS